ncbi:MAG: hypothetical protein WCK18_02785 [Prolixibacteraceae bacterium]
MLKIPLLQRVRKESKRRSRNGSRKADGKGSRKETSLKADREGGSRRSKFGMKVPEAHRTAGMKQKLSVLQVVKFKVRVESGANRRKLSESGKQCKLKEAVNGNRSRKAVKVPGKTRHRKMRRFSGL